MQVVIVGAGGVGCVYGSKLSAHHDVTLVARADCARAVQERGLRLEGKHAGTFTIKATDQLQAVAPGSFILVTTKVNDSAAAIAPIVPLLDPSVTVARADGVEFDVDFLAVIDNIYGALTNIASMGQDLSRGRKTEIDYLNGAVVALGEQYGVDCPVNRALTSIVNALEDY